MSEPVPLELLDIVVVGASDIGQVREHNEDHFLVGDLDTGLPIDVAQPWAARKATSCSATTPSCRAATPR